MKKIIIAIIALCYLVTTSGFTINKHYCMGQLASAQLVANTNSKCSKCGMHTTKSKGCCNDETTLYKLTEKHSSTEHNFEYSNTLVAFTPQLYNIISFTNIAKYTKKNYYNNTSPPYVIKDRCIFFSNFRI